MASREGNSQGNTKVEKVIILGSGPAGLSAALYAARAELYPLVISGIELGGQAALTSTIENYPGFPDGVGGAEWVNYSKAGGTIWRRVEFARLRQSTWLITPFGITTDSGNYLTESVIIATGASPNHSMYR